MIKGFALAAFLLLLGALPSGADDATAPNGGKYLVPNNDIGVGSDGSMLDMTSYNLRIGELHAPGGECYILPLHIPTLPPGKRIASIHFQAQLARIDHDGDALGNADLYAIGVRDTNKALPTDYYQGTKPDPKATLIQANFLTPSSPVRHDSRTGPFVETSAAADAAFTKYLNDLCAVPGNSGKYVILRISYDVDTIPRGNNAYDIVTTGADGDDEIPTFIYTLAPK
jgi:hypothetical protein